LIAFALDFVPYVGPAVAAVPAILIGLTAESGPITGLYVAGLYLGLQTLEGYLIQPLVQQRAVMIPPALLLFAQILLAVVLGARGVIVATPLAAAGLVLVKMLYV
jgi:predicted PurR-regulated permease PerM